MAAILFLVPKIISVRPIDDIPLYFKFEVDWLNGS